YGIHAYGLGVDAVEHRDLRGVEPTVDQVRDGARHRRRLRVLVRVLGQAGFRPWRPHAPQGETGRTEASRAGTDHGVRQVDDLRRGPVVRFQPHDGRTGEPLGEAQQEIRLGTGEGVDSLVDVP